MPCSTKFEKLLPNHVYRALEEKVKGSIGNTKEYPTE
jgi:hypothetical protein